MSQRTRRGRKEMATPEYVSGYIGVPENGYHRALKLLAEAVSEPVAHPHGGAFDPAPENTITPDEIAGILGTKEPYITREFIGEFIRNDLVYYNGEVYVLLPRSERHVSTVIDRTEGYELGAVERSFIRVDEWLLERME